MKKILHWIFISNPRTFVAILGILSTTLVAIFTAIGQASWGPPVTGILAAISAGFTAWAGLETASGAQARIDAKKEPEENGIETKDE